MVAVTIFAKNFVSNHTTSWSSTSTVGYVCMVRKDESTGALVHSADFANTYYYPSPVHIMRKNPVFDGRIHIDLRTYHYLP